MLLIPYKKVNFLWITNHYDVHLSGLCVINNKICLFNTIVDYDTGEYDSYDDLMCKITQLTFLEKLKFLFEKWLFELCVGTHWTYPDRLLGSRPKDSNSILYKVYNRVFT